MKEADGHLNTAEHAPGRSPKAGKWQSVVRGLEAVYDSKWLLWGIVALAIGLRLQNYLADFDMFDDEVFVASSILNRTYAELLKPLDYFQNAPIGFLMVVEFFTHVFASTETEYALRLYSLLTAVASVPLFWLLARKVLSRRAVPLAVFLFAASKYLVGYSSEVKQYSGDAMVTVVLLLTSLWIMSRKLCVSRLVLYALIGALGIWFSQPAVFILAGIGIYWSVQALTRRRIREFICLLPVFLFWALNFAVYYFTIASKYVQNDNYLRYFAKSFMPWPPTSYSDLCWFPNLLMTGIEAPGGFRPQVAIVICLLLIAGYAVLYRSQRNAFFVFLSFLPLVLVASGLKLFPLQHRIVLFAVPMLILGVAQGTTYVAGRLFRAAPWAAVAVVLIVALPSFLEIRKFPFKPFRSEGREAAIEYFSRHRQPQDIIYLHRGAERALDYYAPRYGLEDVQFVLSVKRAGSMADYAEDIEKLRGRRRVWALLHNKFRRNGVHEKSFYLYCLDRAGRRLDTFEKETFTLYLYDLTQPEQETSSPSDPQDGDKGDSAGI